MSDNGKNLGKYLHAKKVTEKIRGATEHYNRAKAADILEDTNRASDYRGNVKKYGHDKAMEMSYKAKK
jgi:hypothetical protein